MTYKPIPPHSEIAFMLDQQRRIEARQSHERGGSVPQAYLERDREAAERRRTATTPGARLAGEVALRAALCCWAPLLAPWILTRGWKR